MIDVSVYPSNYNFISKREYEEILKKLNSGEDFFSLENRDYAKSLEERGIFARYGWPGNRRKWILATYQDAELYEDYMFQCADY